MARAPRARGAPRDEAGSAALQAIWAELKGHLAQRVAQLNEEIRHYPTPIARCDEQLGALLEQRAALIGRLKQMDGFAAAAPKRQNHVLQIHAVLDLPSDPADQQEQRLRARLKHQLSKPGR